VRLNAPAVPRPTEVENTTDPAVCGRSHTLEDLIVSGTTRGVANVIVALGDVPAGSVPPQAAGTLVLDNRDCRFVPHAAVLTAGGTIEIVNSDPTLHTVHFYGPVDLNIALPLRGMRIARRLDRTGLVAVRCDVHGWMQAYIRVDTHPFHAVTDASGAFRIAGVPPGEYAVGVWHERLGARSERVRIRPGAVTRTEFHYTLGSGGG
jgi:plastocyanin